MIIWDNMDYGQDHPVNTLFRARSVVDPVNDWQAFAVITEAILAFKYSYSKSRVRVFSRAILGK